MGAALIPIKIVEEAGAAMIATVDALVAFAGTDTPHSERLEWAAMDLLTVAGLPVPGIDEVDDA